MVGSLIMALEERRVLERAFDIILDLIQIGALQNLSILI
jgi:hypothetical protein